MNKTRLLFCLADFKQGGIPRCLQSLLMNLDNQKFDIDLICLYQKGPYKNAMPNCHVFKEDYILSQLMVHTKKISSKKFISYLPAIFLKLLRSILIKTTKKDLIEIRLNAIAKKLHDKTYHTAIAYAEGYPAHVIHQINSKKKILWIHNNYDWVHLTPYIESITNFSKFHAICCVSNTSKEAFDRAYPQYSHKSLYIYNIINYPFIKEQANIPVNDTSFNKNAFTIVSIGRVCMEKQFDVIPAIAAELRNAGHCFSWYIIGGGPNDAVQRVKNEILKYDIGNWVILLGERENPYQYLQQADLFVLTSHYESYPTVINEARVLGIPIVSINIPAAIEMLSNNEGILTSLEEMSNAIGKLISSPTRIASMRSYPFANNSNSIIKQLEVLFTEYQSHNLSHNETMVF